MRVGAGVTIMRRLFLFSTNRLPLAGVLLVTFTFGFSGHSQHASHTEVPGRISVHGIVRDSGGHAVGGIAVSFQTKDAPPVVVQTDSVGSFHLSAARGGDYTISVAGTGFVTATVGPFALADNESKTVDVTVEPDVVSDSKSAQAKLPEFFDEPRFTVAGVTDTTNLGGHGSDTVMRNREALAKATAEMSRPAAATTPNSFDAPKEKSLRQAAEHHPDSFEANYQLGRLLVDEGKARDAVIYLKQASRLKPDHDESHHLLGKACEKLSDPLEAVREFQRAAELNPSEPYFFDWGSELLLHHAAEPAVEVFAKGKRLFPRSARMLAGLGASWYALGSYEQAVQRLIEASDLDPDDPHPYLFMGKMQAVESVPSDAVLERLKRFVTLQPANAQGNYYYAVALRKRQIFPEDDEDFAYVKSLLEKAVKLDPSLGVAYLQLGILYSDRKDLTNAIAAYQRAIAATPELEEAHYRLGQAYRKAGEVGKAQEELQLYERISKEKAATAERERHEIQQFVYELKEAKTAAPPK